MYPLNPLWILLCNVHVDSNSEQIVRFKFNPKLCDSLLRAVCIFTQMNCITSSEFKTVFYFSYTRYHYSQEMSI